jgi:hypothetical protein
LGIEDDALDGFVEDERLIEGATSGIFGKTEGAGGVSLRIAINDESALFGSGERGAEVDGGGGFAYSAFLISNSDDASHESPECKGNL